MFNNFSAAANACVAAARTEAQKRNQAQLGLPHLLIGIVRTQPDLLPSTVAANSGTTSGDGAAGTPLDRFVEQLSSKLVPGATVLQGQVKATTEAIRAVKQADALMAA